MTRTFNASTHFLSACAWIACLLTTAARPLTADDSSDIKVLQTDANAQQPVVVPSSSPGTRRALIVCGLSGDAAHRKLFVETTTKLHEGLSKQLGFTPENVQILFGDESQDSDIEPLKSAPRSTREELEKTVSKLREQLRPEDALWVIVVGHSHYDGKHSWLNLPGPDLHQLDFAKLFSGLAATQQVFVITTPTSGYYIKPLSAKGRVVITATETDWETNETEFHTSSPEFSRRLLQRKTSMSMATA